MAEVVYKQIADDLRSRIVSGQLSPGEDVPTEAELAQQWSTSRGPIRNALAALRQEGLIETTRGRPARVRTRKAHQAVDVSIPFTRWATDIGAAPGAQTQEVSLRKADAEKAAALDIPEGASVVDVLRLRLLDSRPTMLERLTYIEPVGRLLFGVDLDTVSITEYLISHGQGSASVDHEIDAVAADDVDARLLEVPVGSPLLRLRRVSRDAEGRTIEASDDRYLSDIVRFTVAASGRSRQGDAYVRPLGSA
ncbi:GntR family transcriptional regulator [Microbacterium yannicii]|uniref:GntR family transcriptional regulator n=1 Tax=Microbacterium yannicii TaxID=671622 RepID=UPI00030F630D|nr:GntR family transcriptional regulator [Microbacterium yannicii]